MWASVAAKEQATFRACREGSQEDWAGISRHFKNSPNGPC